MIFENCFALQHTELEFGASLGIMPVI